MNDTSKIPRGIYCHTITSSKNGKRKINSCQYWSMREDKPYQENGYCSYLKRGDWELDSFSLLWDMCKECNENEDD